MADPTSKPSETTTTSSTETSSWAGHNYDLPYDNSQIKAFINAMTRYAGYGDVERSMSIMMYGVNPKGATNIAPSPANGAGLVFFTRPLMNLSPSNLSKSDDPKLAQLISAALNLNTAQAAVRDLLCPNSIIDQAMTALPPGRCALIDDKSPFIACLSNALVSLPGFPDMQQGTFTSDSGPHRTEWTLIDDTIKHYSTFPLTANFRNVRGGVIPLLFDTWLNYQAGAYLGHIVPWEEMRAFNERDTNTAIWRFLLDSSRRITGWCRTIALPTSLNTGSLFSYNADMNRNSEQDTVSVNFQCDGFEYNDKRLLSEFNALMAMFDYRMANLTQYESPYGMRKLTDEEIVEFGQFAKPYIDIEEARMDWYIPEEDYQYLVNNQNFNAVHGWAGVATATESPPPVTASSNARPSAPINETYSPN